MNAASPLAPWLALAAVGVHTAAMLAAARAAAAIVRLVLPNRSLLS